MEIKKLRCPECGANFESDEKVSFCSHCGAKLFLDDGTKTVNYNYNYKTEDVAKIKEVEANKEIKLESMKESQNLVEKFVLFAILIPAIIVVMIIIGALL